MDNSWTWTSADCNEYETLEVDITRLLGGLDIKEFIYRTNMETIRNIRWLFPTEELIS